MFARFFGASILPLLCVLPGVAQTPSPANDYPESREVRLYFNRHASEIAAALSGMSTDVAITSLGNDLLVFQPKDAAGDKQIRELKRWVALLDAPRPELTVNAWSVQVSSADDNTVRDISRIIRDAVNEHNTDLQHSMYRAWTYLDKTRRQPEYLHSQFARYVTQTYQANSKLKDIDFEVNCARPQYCLGYEPTYADVMQPTISNFVGVLVAIGETDTAGRFVDCLEAKPSCPVTDGEAGTEHAPQFPALRIELQRMCDRRRLALLRTGMADALFEYKLAGQYPHQFDPLDYTTSAQVLDSGLYPILTALNQDLLLNLRNTQDQIGRGLHGKQIKFSSDGIVTVHTIGGTDSTVNTMTESNFDETPPALVQDFLKHLGDAEKNIPTLVSANLAPHAAAALLAFLQSGHSSTVSMGRALNLTLTPTTLAGASSAELKVRLESKEEAAPTETKSDGTTGTSTTDRVANHTVDTNIRVDSLGMFEVSTLSADLSRGREPIPLLPPFVDLPYIGSFVKLKRSPATMQHRSFVVMSAAILPTAADLLNNMRYERDMRGDQMLTALTDAELTSIRRVHRHMLHCISEEAFARVCEALPVPEGNETVAQATRTGSVR